MRHPGLDSRFHGNDTGKIVFSTNKSPAKRGEVLAGINLAEVDGVVFVA